MNITCGETPFGLRLIIITLIALLVGAEAACSQLGDTPIPSPTPIQMPTPTYSQTASPTPTPTPTLTPTSVPTTPTSVPTPTTETSQPEPTATPAPAMPTPRPSQEPSPTAPPTVAPTPQPQLPAYASVIPGGLVTIDVSLAGGGSPKLGSRPGTIEVSLSDQKTRFDLFAESSAGPISSTSLRDPPIKMSPLLIPGDGIADFFAAIWTDSPGQDLNIALFLDTDWSEVVDGPLSVLTVELVKSEASSGGQYGEVVILGENSMAVDFSEAINGVYVSQLSFKQDNNFPGYDRSPRIILTNMPGSPLEVLDRTEEHALEGREVYIQIVGTRVDPALMLDEALEEISARVVELRQIEPLREVARDILTRSELRAFLSDELESEARDEMLRSQGLLSILGLIPDGTDLFQLAMDLLTEQVLGLYDSETEKMYLVGDSDELTSNDCRPSAIMGHI